MPSFKWRGTASTLSFRCVRTTDNGGSETDGNFPIEIQFVEPRLTSVMNE